MIALGQIVGAPLAGYAIEAFGHTTTFGIFAAFGLLVDALPLLMPKGSAGEPAAGAGGGA